jgi:hypothetical protein
VGFVDVGGVCYVNYVNGDVCVIVDDNFFFRFLRIVGLEILVGGDETDLRFLDAKGGHVVALTAKGKARYDKSGFVRDKNGGFRA